MSIHYPRQSMTILIIKCITFTQHPTKTKQQYTFIARTHSPNIQHSRSTTKDITTYHEHIIEANNLTISFIITLFVIIIFMHVLHMTTQAALLREHLRAVRALVLDAQVHGVDMTTAVPVRVRCIFAREDATALLERASRAVTIHSDVLVGVGRLHTRRRCGLTMCE